MLLNLALRLIFLNEIRARDTHWNILSRNDLHRDLHYNISDQWDNI